MASVGRIADELAAHLRDRILTGAISGGTQLAEQSVAREYDVARPTARTAMTLLEEDGLLTRHPHLPATVSLIPASEVPEILRLLEVSEDLALGSILRNDPDVRPLRRSMTDSVHAFLDTLVELSGSQRLIRVHRRSTYELLLAEATSPSTVIDVEHVLSELARATLVQDAEGAEKALTEVQLGRRLAFETSASVRAR